MELHDSSPRGVGARSRRRTPRPHARDLEVVEGGTPRRISRLQPECQGPHHRLRLLGAAFVRRARLRTADVGGACQRPTPQTSRCSQCRLGASLERAIRTPPWMRTHRRWSRCRSLAAQDEASVWRDAPWPPHFVKQEGEGKRVQPSKTKPFSHQLGGGLLGARSVFADVLLRR